ncbi:hypothetical protein B0T17DRAFT_584141 [Bombardia bombarda]|uniref:Uncharacterized protein n=1 Tax=Bombardia bombarda TaxID=252184 RepID=A0AA39U4Q6_9PEZI|nr:hypothetical protein B0T17DRAFT_584141 [Bombardia bombarda]
MDKKQTSPELSQAGLLPTQDEQVPANPSARKRQPDSDEGAGPRKKRAQTTSEPARLTRKNLALLNKMNNTEGSKKTSTHLDSTDSSSTRKTLSTTASGFVLQARENGILDPFDSKPPKNLKDIRKRLAEPRATPSATVSAYKNHVYTVGVAPNEATLVGKMLPLLIDYPKGYKWALNRGFTAFPKDVGFNNGLSAPQPDYVEGLGLEEYRPLPVYKHVNGAVLYKDDLHSMTLPHLAGEWKCPSGNMKGAEATSGYDGAALVYARNQALAYQGKSDPPGHASITTFTTNGKELNFYAHYAAPAENDKLEYHQYLVKSMSLVNSHREYKDGRRALRNEQDHAKRQSEALRDQLKAYYKKKDERD